MLYTNMAASWAAFMQACADLNLDAARNAWIALGHPDLLNERGPNPLCPSTTILPLDLVMEHFHEDQKVNGDHSALISFLQSSGCFLSLDGLSYLITSLQLQVDMVNQGLMLHGLDMVDVRAEDALFDEESYFAWTLTHVWNDTGGSQLALQHYTALINAGLDLWPFGGKCKITSSNPPSIEGVWDAQHEVAQLLWPNIFGRAAVAQNNEFGGMQWSDLERDNFIDALSNRLEQRRKAENWRRRSLALMCSKYGSATNGSVEQLLQRLYNQLPEAFRDVLSFF